MFLRDSFSCPFPSGTRLRRSSRAQPFPTESRVRPRSRPSPPAIDRSRHGSTSVGTAGGRSRSGKTRDSRDRVACREIVAIASRSRLRLRSTVGVSAGRCLYTPRGRSINAPTLSRSSPDPMHARTRARGRPAVRPASHPTSHPASRPNSRIIHAP